MVFDEIFWCHQAWLAEKSALNLIVEALLSNVRKENAGKSSIKKWRMYEHVTFIDLFFQLDICQD